MGGRQQSVSLGVFVKAGFGDSSHAGLIPDGFLITVRGGESNRGSGFVCEKKTCRFTHRAATPKGGGRSVPGHGAVEVGLQKLLTRHLVSAEDGAAARSNGTGHPKAWPRLFAA